MTVVMAVMMVAMCLTMAVHHVRGGKPAPAPGAGRPEAAATNHVQHKEQEHE